MVSQRLKVLTIGFVLLIDTLAIAAKPPREVLLRLQELVQQGDIENARSQLQSAIKEFPSEPGLYNLLGTVEAEKGNRSDAESAFRKAVAIAPDFTGALLNLGRLYLEQAATDAAAHNRALTVYQKILRYDSDNSEALYQSAALLAAGGSYQASLSHLDKLPADVQARAQVLAVRCSDQAALHQDDRAASTAEQLLKSSDLTEGDVFAILPQVEPSNEPLAVWMLERLAARPLAGQETLLQLGRLYERQEHLPQARETLERAEQSGQPSAATLSELARVAYQQHDLEGALGYLAHARELDPTNAAVHFFFGVVCIQLNLPLDARKSLDEAVRLNPNNPYYNYALGSVALHGHDPAQAAPYFEKYVDSKPRDPSGRFALGVVRFYMAEYGAAEKEMRSVTGNPHTAPGAHYFLGRIAKLQENLPEAERELRDSVAADPKFADALAELGLLHIRLHNYDEAGRELERAFAVEPDNFRVNANLLILYRKLNDPRAAQQQARFEGIEKQRDADEQLLWRTIEVHPY